jgi:SPP1 gp7 family putative phage head morphogenesis protein
VVRRARRRLPEPRSRIPLERKYARAIVRAVVEPAIGAVRRHVLPVLRELEEVSTEDRTDRDPKERILEAIRRAKDEAALRTSQTEIREAAASGMRAAHAFQAEQLEFQVGALADRDATRKRALGKRKLVELGVDPFGSEPWLRGAMRDAVERNVRLIRSIPAKHFRDIESLVSGGILDGAAVDVIALAIEARFGVTSRRAELIAADQVGKFHSKLDQLRMTDLGVEEYVWRTSLDEKVRPEHEKRDGQTFRMDEPPEDGHPGEPVRCFPGWSAFAALHATQKLYRRWYSGELTELVTDDGIVLAATPNHPVMSQRGWLPMQSLEIGDHVFKARGQRIERSNVDTNHRVPSARECFETLALLSVPEVSAGSALQFHGDGSEGDVDIVDVDRFLTLHGVTATLEFGGEHFLAWADDLPACGRNLEPELARLFPAADLLIRRASKLLALLRAESRHAHNVGLTLAPDRNVRARQTSTDSSSADPELLHQLQLALAGDVLARQRAVVHVLTILRAGSAPCRHTSGAELERKVVGADPEPTSHFLELESLRIEPLRIVEKHVREFAGHVYNLQTESEWYTCNELIVHNCRCYREPIIPGLE